LTLNSLLHKAVSGATRFPKALVRDSMGQPIRAISGFVQQAVNRVLHKRLRLIVDGHGQYSITSQRLAFEESLHLRLSRPACGWPSAAAILGRRPLGRDLGERLIQQDGQVAVGDPAALELLAVGVGAEPSHLHRSSGSTRRAPGYPGRCDAVLT
jgi:hypothetical protein